MKKIIAIVAIALMTVTAQAQRPADRKEDRKERVQNMNPEVIASVQAKRMTLALDLSDKQENEIEKVLLSNAVKRKAAMENKADRKEMSKEERAEMAEDRLNEQIATKRAMKQILNDEQYAKFEKMKDRRKGKGERARERRARK